MAVGRAAAWSDGPLCAARSEQETQSLCRSVPVRLALSESNELCWPDALEGASDATEPVDTIALARQSFKEADALYRAGKLEDALLHLRSVEREPLRVLDRIALRRGELLRELKMPAQACDAFALAVQSPDREVAVRAQIGSVYCAFEAGDRKGEAQLQALLTRYPHLTERDQLNLALALARERWGNRMGAVALLRHIELEHPATQTATRARAELARLAELGARPEPYTWRERVQRAERLLHGGPLEQAAAAVEEMREDGKTNPSLRVQVEQLSARIARLQGRFGLNDQADSARSVETNLIATGPMTIARAPSDVAERSAHERRIQNARGNKTTQKLSPAQMRQLFELALEYRDKRLCNEMLDAIRTRPVFDSRLRFALALRATGLCGDIHVAELLETLLDAPGYRVSARYHRARALERLGQLGVAEAEYHGVIASDDGPERYYTMWSNIRLSALRERSGASCISLPSAPGVSACGSDALPDVPSLGEQGAAGREELVATAESEPESQWRADAGMVSVDGESFEESATSQLPGPQSPPASQASPAINLAAHALAPGLEPDARRRVRALGLVAPLAERYGDAYPWLLRAQDLIELDRFEEAADEISEAYIAWRDAAGKTAMRSGLLSLVTGAFPPRRQITPALRKARLAFDAEARLSLSELSTLLGDPGIGFRFSHDADFQPRAYADVVESAAAKYGLDPNLLFAVMRVESVFNRRIISNAGAVGLMQIMPHTGQRIAYRMGIDDYDPVQLLEPKRNLEFSAWYLASLLQRFDGRLPLAIASYNGGPHNVRLWLRNNHPDMPLDAFLERIPFKETNNYVRRVLTFYAAYRAQQHLPMAQLTVELPRLQPDEIAF